MRGHIFRRRVIFHEPLFSTLSSRSAGAARNRELPVRDAPRGRFGTTPRLAAATGGGGEAGGGGEERREGEGDARGEVGQGAKGDNCDGHDPRLGVSHARDRRERTRRRRREKKSLAFSRAGREESTREAANGNPAFDRRRLPKMYTAFGQFAASRRSCRVYLISVGLSPPPLGSSSRAKEIIPPVGDERLSRSTVRRFRFDTRSLPSIEISFKFPAAEPLATARQTAHRVRFGHLAGRVFGSDDALCRAATVDD